MMTLLQILGNSPTDEHVEQVHALMRRYSAKFAEYGDPRTYESKNLVMSDVLDFAWLSGSARMVFVANFDEWQAGSWNHIEGVVKPRARSDES